MAPKRKAGGSAVGVAAGSNKFKQGNLFSFFSKPPAAAKSAKTKPAVASTKLLETDAASASSSLPLSQTSSTSTVPSLSTAPVASKSASPPKNDTKKNQNKELDLVKVGVRIEVYWPDDEEYYAGRVTKQQQRPKTRFFVEYDDGQTEWIDLSLEKFRILGEDNGGSKRRRIIEDEDDDEEAEFEMDDAEDDDVSEGSAFVPEKAKELDEEDEEDLVVTDVEEEDEIKTKKAKKKTTTKPTFAVTEVKAPASCTKGTSTSLSSSFAYNPSDSASKQPLPKRVTPASTRAPSNNDSSPYQQVLPKASSSAHDTPTKAQSLDSSRTAPAAYTRGCLNAAGSHVHNHLKFLLNPKDAQGRSPDHPDYDHRTLRVDHKEWEKETGSEMTHAVKQWWDLKSQYFDTVLLFKTGKFYEMHHMDADIGVQYCDLSYMKGHTAHAGFPEAVYGPKSEMLVRAGFKVARVEQTETPDQLKERKKKYKGKNSPKVVNREVCSILTLGTRTFCYLDDTSGLMDDGNGGNGVGPLLAISELPIADTTMSQNNEDGEDAVQPVCEYGVTLVDAVRGTVTIGQFADDVLRSRMNTLLMTYSPSEILLQGGEGGASPTLHSLIRLFQATSHNLRVEVVQREESFPKSTAIDDSIRRKLERSSKVHPWDVGETIHELHRKQYYPKASKKKDDTKITRWPKVLRAIVEGGADLALSSFGAALFYLQRNLIDQELLSMGIVKAYIPPPSAAVSDEANQMMSQLAEQQSRQDSSADENVISSSGTDNSAKGPPPMEFSQCQASTSEEHINHMALDGTTLQNLEILVNTADHTSAGSLWSIINHAKTPHGSRLLRAWLLRPLFRVNDINRRTDAVQELVSGSAAVAMNEASVVLAKCGDIERLLARVHSMSGGVSASDDDDDDVNAGVHPNERAVLYESATYTKRMVGDFAKVLNGLRRVTRIPEVFKSIEIESPLLRKIVRHVDDGGCFPDMIEELDWFFANFDCDQAAKGFFEPSKGVDHLWDEACDTIARIEADLQSYKEEMCATALNPRGLAKSSWKYINTKPESKDKYLVELPASISVPGDFVIKGKRGSGAKQVNKYRTSFVEELVQELEHAFDVQKKRKALGMRLIFAKFDSMRNLWGAAAQATALLDALGALAKASTDPGYTRAQILECPPDESSSITVVQGRHPCVEKTLGSGEFVPNDLSLGSEEGDRVLLLSGVNMGGKSTCLRQTCLIAIMAQIGCFVPAEFCSLTPVDRIFTRLGASDRILMGQSTFFVELAETAAALRGASRRSLVIMDELGRGTSTFDGTAIASAAVKHLVERCKCLTLFATHYHSLLDEWKDHPKVRLGHMECIVENGNVTNRSGSEEDDNDGNITFLYTLGEGGCPKSFGINVARLAGLPQEVLTRAKRISSEFEEEINGANSSAKLVTARTAKEQRKSILDAIQKGEWDKVSELWQTLQS